MGGLRDENRYHKLLSVNSPVIAGFLYAKFTQAEKQGCKIDYFIKLSENEERKLPEYRLVEMLGILFDNAREAVSGQEEKTIFVQVMETTKELQICVKNPSEYIPQTELVRFVKSGYSTKGEGRGLGLASLTSIVHQYEGELAIYNESRE
jgi:sensor histidine kinase regulating citrate/malate metabolism